VEFVGIDWSYRRAAWCALSEGGHVLGEGVVPADEDGLVRLVIERGTEVRGVVEMMSGAIWVRDRLADAAWEMQIAHARNVRDVAPLACKTDKVDARVLAELCRRDLVPELWVPSLSDRELRERLRRRAHLVRIRASAMNRIFGLLTQWGMRLSLKRLRAADAMQLLAERGIPAVWRRSIGEALELIDLLDSRIARLEQELRPLARADARVALLDTIPGIGDLLGLTLASEIGDVSRFVSPRKLIGYAGLSPKINQSGDRSRTGALSKAGSRTLRWAAVEAAQQAWLPRNPWHRLDSDLTQRAGKNPAKAAVARKILIAAWHILARNEPFKAAQPAAGPTVVSASSRCFLAA
jgi:transposase